MSDREHNFDYLSEEEFIKVVEIINASATQVYNLTLLPTKQEKIRFFMLDLCVSDLYSFFTLPRLRKLTADVFEDGVIRSFVLNLVERASLQLVTLNEDMQTILTRTVSKAVTANKPLRRVATNSLVNEEVSDTLHIYEKDLFALLEQNYWVTILYIFAARYDGTSLVESDN